MGDALDVTGAVTLNDATASSSSTTGALIVGGGVGVALDCYVGQELHVTGNATMGGVLDVTGAMNLTDTTQSSSAITGALVVDGGVGIAKDVHVGGGTASSSTTTGALVVAGGAGIGGAVNIGGTLTVTGDLTVAGTTTTMDTQTLLVEDNTIVINASSGAGSAENIDAGLLIKFHSDNQGSMVFTGAESEATPVNGTTTIASGMNLRSAVRAGDLIVWHSSANNSTLGAKITGVTATTVTYDAHVVAANSQGDLFNVVRSQAAEETVSSGTSVTVFDTTNDLSSTFAVGDYVVVSDSTDNAAPKGDVRQISGISGTAITVSAAFSAQLAAGDEVMFYKSETYRGLIYDHSTSDFALRGVHADSDSQLTTQDPVGLQLGDMNIDPDTDHSSSTASSFHAYWGNRFATGAFRMGIASDGKLTVQKNVAGVWTYAGAFDAA